MKARLSLSQKGMLIALGIIIAFIMLEFGLRFTGLIISLPQAIHNWVRHYEGNAFRILCLGESTTAGGAWGYPYQLEQNLNERNLGITFRVINKGTVAVTTTYIARNLEECLREYRPHMVVTMMGINDTREDIVSFEPNDSGLLQLIKHFATYRLGYLIYLHARDRMKQDDLAHETRSRHKLAELEQNAAHTQLRSTDAFSWGYDMNNPIQSHLPRAWGADDLDQAEQLFMRILTAEPDHGEALRGLAHTYFRKKNMREQKKCS